MPMPVLPFTPAEASKVCTHIKESAGAASNDGVVSSLFIRVGPAESVRADAMSYNDNLPNYRKYFAKQGLSTVDDVVAQACMPLDPDAVRERLADYYAQGVDVPCIYPSGMTTEQILELLDAVNAGTVNAGKGVQA